MKYSIYGSVGTITKRETVEEFLARGGKITYLKHLEGIDKIIAPINLRSRTKKVIARRAATLRETYYLKKLKNNGDY